MNRITALFRGRPERVVSYVLLAVALVAGSFLRFYGLSAKPFWVGEIQEILNARSDLWLAMLNDAATDLVGYGWHHLVFSLGARSNLEFWHRLLAALCSIATIPAVYFLGKRSHSRLVGAMAAVMVALSFVHVYHGQDARSISYESLGVVLFYLALLHLVLDQNYRWVPLLLLGTALLSLSHASGLVQFFLGGATFLAIAWHLERKSPVEPGKAGPVRKLLLAALPATAVASLQLVALASFTQFMFLVDMDQFEPHQEFTAVTGLEVFSQFSTYLVSFSGAVVIPLVLLALAGLCILWTRSRPIAVALGVCFFVPGILFPTARILGKLPHFDLYHLNYLLPVFLVLLCAGVHGLASVLLYVVRVKKISRWRPMVAALLVMGIAVGGNASMLVRYHQRPTRLNLGQDYRAAAQYMDEKGVSDTDCLAFLYSDNFYSLNFYAGYLFRHKRLLTLQTEPKRFLHAGLRMHSGDFICESDIPTLLRDNVQTADDFGINALPYSGTVWIVMSLHETMGGMTGLTSYSEWFEMDSVGYGDSPPAEALPEGFVASRFPGVIVIAKRYDGAPRTLVARETEQLLIRYATPMSSFFHPQAWVADGVGY